MSSEKNEGFLVSFGAKLAFLDENEKHRLAQYLSEDNGPFGQSTPEILASLLDYCEEITKQQATEANEATIFLNCERTYRNHSLTTWKQNSYPTR